MENQTAFDIQDEPDVAQFDIQDEPVDKTPQSPLMQQRVAENKLEQQAYEQAQQPFTEKAGGIVKGVYEGMIEKPFKSFGAASAQVPDVWKDGTVQAAKTIGASTIEGARRFSLPIVHMLAGNAEKLGKAIMDYPENFMADPVKGAANLNPLSAVANYIGDGIKKSLFPYVPTPEELHDAVREQMSQNALQVETEQGMTPGANPEVADAIASIAPLFIPAGKGTVLSQAGKAAKLTGRELLDVANANPVSVKLSSALKASAEKSVAQALNPTTLEHKAIVQRIAPEILKRPAKETFALSKAGLAEKAAEKMEKAGEAIGAFGKLKGDINPQKITDALESLKQPYIVEGKVIDQAAIDRISGIQDIFRQYGDSLSKEGLRAIRRTFDDEVKASKGFFVESKEGTLLDIKKTASNEIRRVLAEAEPDLAKLNKQFNFWSNLSKVAEKQVTRSQGQMGAPAIIGAVAGAVTGHGFWNAIHRAITMKYAMDAIRSPGWKLAGARIKNTLANALATGHVQKIERSLATIKSAGYTKGMTVRVLDGEKQFDYTFNQRLANGQIQVKTPQGFKKYWPEDVRPTPPVMQGKTPTFNLGGQPTYVPTDIRLAQVSPVGKVGTGTPPKTAFDPKSLQKAEKAGFTSEDIPLSLQPQLDVIRTLYQGKVDPAIPYY